MTPIPPPAEELRLLDAELRQLDARRAVLLHRRAWLVHVLQPRPGMPAGPVAAPRVPPARRPEATAPGVQNVLLLLGGALLTVAAIAFTLVSWGHLGIVGRSVVLGAVTAAVLGSPAVLLRRGLRSTAESLAGLGLVLTVLDAYALRAAALPHVDGFGYAAFASAALAVGWAAYGHAFGARRAGPAGAGREPGAAPDAAGRPGRGSARGLRLPLPAAVFAAQFPLVLWALAVGAEAHAVTAALLATAALDATVALRFPATAVRVAAAAGAFGLGGSGTLAGFLLSWTASGPSAAAQAAALLLLAASIALTVAWTADRPGLATGAAAAGGLIAVGAAGGVLRTLLPAEWTVTGHVVCGLLLLAAVRPGVPEPVRRGTAAASGTVQALAVLAALPAVAVSVVGPLARLGSVWSGAPASAREAVTDGLLPVPSLVGAPVVLGLVAAVLVRAVRSADQRPRALVAAVVLTWGAALTLPAALGLSFTGGLVAHALTTAALLAHARRARPAVTPAVLALATSVDLALLALASRPATLAVSAALALVFAVTARRPGLGPFAAPAAVAHATVLACAAAASFGWQPPHAGLLVLVVPALAALSAARSDDVPTTVAVEIAGTVAALVAVALAATDLPTLATVLALCGVVAAATAARADRRSVGYAATALFVLAAWVRLTAWGVSAPEAYTLPVSVPALFVGAYRRRVDPAVSSWTAYAPGLCLTLVPSLMAAWADAQAARPLLLGAAALAVTLLGARHRLQAPLALGGAALLLDALHELAPYIVQLVDALPRWVPLALAGALLLGLGATYEQRLRDARRVRDVLGRMG
ncbi:SCO7613 C-terminal domain-containing membrane protein [Streptomyces sp. NPDC048566]|uniref:SCO7613 C-terminal domain-containing membrane protein n=1 Tax=Streptomyces sp. NPDC048566 TaxID=3365569 RepID=UPI00371CA2A6